MKKKSPRRRLKMPTIAEATKHSYTEVLCVYRGVDHDLDRKLEKLAKQRTDGSGFEFRTSLRDINFDFKTKAKAVAAAKRIKAARLPVRVVIRGFWSP